MPRKKVKRTAKKAVNKYVNKEASSIHTRGIKESLLFLFSAIGIFLVLSLYSYSPSDPAWSHTISEPEQSGTQNLGGIIGSNFADVSYYLLGYLAYFIPLMMAIIGWVLYQSKAEDNFYSWNFSLRIFGFILSVISGCALATMHFELLIAFPSEIGSGGILGLVVAQQLNIWFSFVGSTLILLTLFLVGITFFSHLSWFWLMDSIGKWTFKGITFFIGASIRSVQFTLNWIKTNLITSNNIADDIKLEQKIIDKEYQVETKTAKLDISTHQQADHFEADDFVEDEQQKQSLAKKVFSAGHKVKENISTQLKKFSSTAVNIDPADENNNEDCNIDYNQDYNQDYLVEEQDLSVEKSIKIEPVFNKISHIPDNLMQDTPVPSVKQGSVAENFQTLNRSFSNEGDNNSDKQGSIEQALTGDESDDSSRPKKPIQIQTANQPVKVSSRGNQEKQKLLFHHDAIDGLPALSLLDPPRPSTNMTSAEELEYLSRSIEEKLADYNMTVEVVAVQQGPVITRFELQLAPGIKVSQLSNLSKDLARALLVVSIRIVEVIAGKPTVGIEIPNKHREIVSFYEVLNSAVYGDSKALLPLGLGTDISGQPVVADLAKMPHLLVAGTTGSGKSVGVNSMILSMLFHSNPDELRLIMVDPKMLELSIYEGIPHLLCPVVTDMMEAANALRWCVAEMERRYKLMSALGVRNIAGYNKKVKQASEAGEPIMDPLFEPNPMMASLRPDELDTLPYIVIVIDEFADMMMIVGKKVEELIARLAQKARAAGLHLVIATQRPSVNVITGLIKANIPTRIAFQVSSKIDSRTILDQMGAEALLGNGDMLFLPPGTAMPQRIHGAFVSDEEVHKVVDDLKQRGSVEYIDEILSGEGVEEVAGMTGESSGNESDPLYDQAVAIVIETRRASISGIQRRLKVGYNRAARMVEDMEAAGLVSSVQSNGQREILTPPQA